MRRLDDKRIEIWIGWLLRVGTVLSCSVAALGISLYLFNNPAAFPSYHEFEPSRFPSFGTIFSDAFHGDAIAIIEIGILLLIATPLARVAFLVGAFALERDRLYVAVSGLVLAVLLYSVFFIT